MALGAPRNQNNLNCACDFASIVIIFFHSFIWFLSFFFTALFLIMIIFYLSLKEKRSYPGQHERGRAETGLYFISESLEAFQLWRRGQRSNVRPVS